MPKPYGTPGPRVIVPDSCTSQSLASCSMGAQLLFDRLIVQSDDQGRQQAEPSIIKAVCFPYFEEATPKRIAAWLKELERADMVRLYTVGKAALVQLVHWWKFQSGMRRAYPSRWGAPDGWEDRVFGLSKAEQDDHAGNSPAERGQSAGNLPHSAPDFPPHARGSSAYAVAGAIADAGAGVAPDGTSRYGLPHIDPVTAAAMAQATGMSVASANGWPGAELDRLVEQRGADRVQAAVAKAMTGRTEVLSWKQLATFVREELEPPIHRNGAKPAAKGGVSDEEANRAFGRA